MAYKIASDLAQRRARQLWLADIVSAVDFEALEPSEQRAVLVRAKISAESRIDGASKAERKALGLHMHALNSAINAIRPKIKNTPRDVSSHFVDIAKETLTPFVFKMILSKALERAGVMTDSSVQA